MGFRGWWGRRGLTVVKAGVEQGKREGDGGEHADEGCDDAEDEVLAEEFKADGEAAWGMRGH